MKRALAGRIGPDMKLPFVGLDTLWIQVAGTVCNIACLHCFIACGPKNHAHELLSADRVRELIDQAEGEGVREIWFTGGEPFLHPEMVDLLAYAAERAAVGVLTNAMLVDDGLAERLGRMVREAPYNIEIRVSLDGADAASNDRVRGRGVFAATTAGLSRMAREGIAPIVAVTLLDDSEVDRDAFVALLRGLGIDPPRVKWIPTFRIGREERRGRPYQAWEALAVEVLEDPQTPWVLQCGTSRTVTSQGVFPCPILIGEPDRKLGERLEDTLQAHPCDHAACHTCWVEGFSCSA